MSKTLRIKRRTGSLPAQEAYPGGTAGLTAVPSFCSIVPGIGGGTAGLTAVPLHSSLVVPVIHSYIIHSLRWIRYVLYFTKVCMVCESRSERCIRRNCSKSFLLNLGQPHMTHVNDVIDPCQPPLKQGNHKCVCDSLYVPHMTSHYLQHK